MRNQPSTAAEVQPVKLGDLHLPSRRDPVVRSIASAWRRLTTPADAPRNGPGARTLIACSGGGDSSALAIALAVAAGRTGTGVLVVGHVTHDLRPAAEAGADRDFTADLARRLGLPFVEASVAVRDLPGNAEANARRARYEALATLARQQEARFVATAHNSHDAAESVIMALLRGAGPRGLAALAPTRRLKGGCVLIRPMLAVSPTQARSLCTAAGWRYAHDVTNDDATRLRNAIRRDVLPVLLSLKPGAEHRMAAAARRCKEAADTVTGQARRLARAGSSTGGHRWSRARLRKVSPAVLGETLRICAAAGAGPGALDKLPARVVEGAVRLIRSRQTDPKTVRWTGVTLSVAAQAVELRAG